MSQAKHTCEIGGMRFEFYHVSPRPLRSIFIKVLSSLAKSINPDLNLDAGLDTDLSKIFNLSAILNNLDVLASEEQVEQIEKILFSQCVCHYPSNGKIKAINVLDYYDQIFEDDFFMSFLLLKEAFNCYYKDFFEKAGGLINKNMHQFSGEKEKHLK